MDKELGLGMEGVNQALQLGSVCMSRYEISYMHSIKKV